MSKRYLLAEQTISPAELAEATRGARQLTVDFRFRKSGALDSRAIRDLDRLVAFRRAGQPSPLLLFGFGADRNVALERARLVASELERRGVRSASVAAMPSSAVCVRVEAWIRTGP